MPAIDHPDLQLAMDRAGMTPTQLANELGVTVSYVARILKGERRLKRNPVMRAQIARALGVPLHWIETKDADAA